MKSLKNETVIVPLFSGALSSTDDQQRRLDNPINTPLLISYPYIADDKHHTLRNSFTEPRRIPPREQSLQRNAHHCEFEITLDATPVHSDYSTLQNLKMQRSKQVTEAFPPSRNPSDNGAGVTLLDTDDPSTAKVKESLVTVLTGDIISPNCKFAMNMTTTALRINWESTTSKAINYSFYMMLTCLTQIVVLLRQLLHTQAQSAASRVSLLCVGWQAVLDAILCIGHILLCLLMQPLFTAFASVAFFKLLIFCVIEMKYMAIIMQARNAGRGEDRTTEQLRQQVTLLHVRFYAALFMFLTGFWYFGKDHLFGFMTLLYSYWVPQIIYNIVTEAKRPLHNHYIYGMSVTRLVAPVYMFCIKNNFLREAQPDFPRDVMMCKVLVLWVGIQTGILLLQGKYGARFMIPARFLPPKFDYSRPIPPSLLPPPNTSTPPPPPAPTSTLLHTPDKNNSGARHRTNSTRSSSNGNSSNAVNTPTTTTTTITEEPHDPTLDCVICYSSINIHDRRGYMLAPCDHIFHRECLEQWMDVKMECPICRTDLPPI
eukprot:CAMPEP_0172513466 /NCGR_PEP_ID=MMETSP1066-20121228/252708_1 /TAXON_ID=671091 /ORGANISM="Coscinodiscus wailesii, Strain CCMP2513" /LENGTH=541 /DNA_ID=CAMNT_0013293743 /DNA_START=30 /DNA_END=1655 /DNA_ORIENTATION=+